MQKSTVFHEAVFYEHFRPFKHPLARFNIWCGHGLETFGEDLRRVFDYDENMYGRLSMDRRGQTNGSSPAFIGSIAFASC